MTDDAIIEAAEAFCRERSGLVPSNSTVTPRLSAPPKLAGAWVRAWIWVPEKD
jgi:hypothetical protein